jgi:hypothetical protein
MGLTDFGQLFSRRVIEDLKLVNVLAVGVVGTMGGCEIHFNELRRSWRTILLIFALIALMVLPSSTLVMIGFSQLAPGLVPFFNELPMAQIVMGSVLVGGDGDGHEPGRDHRAAARDRRQGAVLVAGAGDRRGRGYGAGRAVLGRAGADQA